jgi:thioredoxin-dependent peroxiredoxin
VVVGVSRDRVEASRGFADKLGLPYLLVADPDGDLGDKLGVPSRAGFYARRTILVSPEGRVAAVLDDVDVRNHAAQVARALRAAGAGR